MNVTDPNNRPTTDRKVSKAKLLARLTPGTKLTLIHGSVFGPCNKHRTVVKATPYQLVVSIADPKRDAGSTESYVRFDTGDEFFLHDQGFTIVSRSGSLCYLFGHRAPTDRPDNTGGVFPLADRVVEALFMKIVLCVADSPERLVVDQVDELMTSAHSALDGGKFDRFRDWLMPLVRTPEAQDAVFNWIPGRRV